MTFIFCRTGVQVAKQPLCEGVFDSASGAVTGVNSPSMKRYLYAIMQHHQYDMFCVQLVAASFP